MDHFGPVELFRKLPNGEPLWLESCASLESAQDRIHELSSAQPGHYFTFDRQNRTFAVAERACLTLLARLLRLRIMLCFGQFLEDIELDPKSKSAIAVEKPLRDRRKYPRFILRVALRLRGTRNRGAEFNETTGTTVVSAGGFSCNCLTHLAEETLMDVFLLAKGGLSLGSARVVRVEPTSPPWLNYSFAFDKPIHNWFLVREESDL